VTLTAHGVYITLTKTHGLFTEIPFYVAAVVKTLDPFFFFPLFFALRAAT
jgi:hypothetical protein